MSKVQQIATTQAPRAIGPYSQGISFFPFVFVSGQLPIDPQTGHLVAKDIRLQTNCVLDNLEAVLAASKCELTDVVRCELFLQDLADFAIVNEEYAKRFSHATPPARQTVQVAALPLNALIEISCIAIQSHH